MKVVLFDLDGTLMLSGGAGRRAMDRAFGELFGISDPLRGVAVGGRTDPAIFREILVSRGRPEATPAESEELVRRYERYLAEEVPRSPDARLMPGVVELLEVLAGREEVLLGLLTGNMERPARIKLERFDLNRFFPFGAFSSDHELRERLVPIAVTRAEAHSGRAIGLGPHVVVVGDTPLDVACALANGATAVGVGTSRHQPGELLAAGAHHALADLSDPDAVLAVLGVG